ncbi:MAG: amidohydrolase family protein [Thermodesulfobacteriota bacterium]
MRVDVHAHFYPQSYMDEIARRGIGEEGGVGIKMPVWTTVEERVAEMDLTGVDVEVIGLSSPNVYFPDDGLSRALAQITNDFVADICRQRPDRFLALASVPLNNMNYAMAELERAIDKLGLHGLVLGTNVNQIALSDDRFLPFFEEVTRRRIPVVIHPMKAIGQDAMPAEDNALAISTNVSFVFDTSRCLAEMAFKGTFERLSDLTLVLPHSGGAIPFLCGRWDMAVISRPEGHRLRSLPHLPSYYLKRHYYDLAHSYWKGPLACTVDFAGIDHVMYGTDWPYTEYMRWDLLEKSHKAYFTEGELEKVNWRNAAALFPGIRPPT